MVTKDKVQGEGDYESARRYQEDAAKAAKKGDAEKKAREAEPKSEADKAELERAEEEGKKRAKK